MSEIVLKLDSGKEFKFNSGIIAQEVVTTIFDEQADIIGIEVGTEQLDLQTPVINGGNLKVVKLTDDSLEAKSFYRHSYSHVLAQAVKRLYPEAKLAIGPAIKSGFYYDFEVETPFTTEDLKTITKEMKKILKESHPFERMEVSVEEAKKILTEMNEPYKLELLEDLKDKGEAISFYKDGEFLDLCRGPHVAKTNTVRNFKLLSVAGAYWKGDEKNKMLQRIYGTAFLNKEAVSYTHLTLPTNREV